MELVGPRYMSRFACLGPDCDDHCCRDWTVPVDKQHYEQLHERMSSPAERAELAAAMEVLDEPENDGRHRHALIVMNDDGVCPLLAPGGMCSLHARYGEELLPDGCATYPRVIGRIGERAELVATTSCPEIARLVLLADDGLELDDLEPARFGRGLISRRISASAPDPFDTTFLPIRGLLSWLLGRRQFPLASRLFFVAFFADRTASSLRRKTECFEVAEIELLGQALGDETELAKLHAQYQSIDVDQPFAISVVRALLALPALRVPPALERIRDAVAPWWAARGAPLDGEAEALHRAYRALPALAPELAARLELLVERYAVQHLLRTWYVHDSTLVAYVHGLLSRVALVRFLVRTLVERDAVTTVADLDALVVRVVYATSRMLEHDADLAAKLLRGLREQGATLAHAVCLIQV